MALGPASTLGISKTHAGGGTAEFFARARFATALARWNFRAAGGDLCTHWKGPSGRNLIDYNVDHAVMANEVGNLTERIAAARNGIARACDSRHDLDFLSRSEYTPRHHRVRGGEFHRLRETAGETLRG
jgi:hypothetical protein